MNDEKNGARARVKSFFNDIKDKEDIVSNAYVYVLLDNGIPFYVGKGSGERCFQHEDELNDKAKQKKAIEEKLKEYKELYNLQNDDYEEIQKLEKKIKKELSAKLERIKSAKKNNTFDVAIVKYGLTEHEAFMCESSVINILKFCNPDMLTNDVNGHASPKEKEIKENLQSDVQARIMSDFLNQCCPPQKTIQEIKDFVIAHITTETKTIKWNKKDVSIDDVAFISYNDLYDICKTDEEIWDAVRGHWYNMSKEKGKSVKYIFAMHNTIVKGIYKVKRDGDTESNFQLTIDPDPKYPFLPVKRDDRQGEARKNESKVLNLVIKLLEKEPELRVFPIKERASKIQEELKKIDKEAVQTIIHYDKNGKEMSTFFQRGFWGCNYEDFNGDSDLKELKEQFLGCQIKEFTDDLEIPQSSVLCLYRNNSKGKRKKKNAKK